MSFAQDNEDIILYRLLEKVREPIHYVDVGANDPNDMSVTKLFYNMGGSGVNIEPQNDLCQRLANDRPDDVNIQCGISDSNGELVLRGTGAGASFDENDPYAIGNEYKVPVFTLTDVWDRYVKNRYDPVHFLKIDVEGWEKNVLVGMDFDRFRPWILCIESTEPGTVVPCWEKWEPIVLANRYKFIGMYGINRYYVATEFLEKVNPFPDRPLDSYYIIAKINMK